MSTAVKFKMFRDSNKTWNEMFTEAAEFASTVGPDRLINIAHSVDSVVDGVVVVWYWGFGESGSADD